MHQQYENGRSNDVSSSDSVAGKSSLSAVSVSVPHGSVAGVDSLECLAKIED